MELKETEGVIENCSRRSRWRQVKHVFSGQGLDCLQRPDLSGSSSPHAGFEERLQMQPVKGMITSGFKLSFLISITVIQPFQ